MYLMPARSDITVVSDRGQTSIPSHIRRTLNLYRGQRLLWRRLSDTEIRIELLEDHDVADPTAMLGFAKKFRKVRKTAAWLKELREGEK